jgi:putative tricarboxylic transport membrane protein
MNAEGREPARERGLVKAPQDLAAGLLLLALAAVGLLGTSTLNFGTLTNIGAGFMPRSVAVMVGAFGVLLVGSSLITDGVRLVPWSVRGLFFVLGAALLFAWTIRPLGLIVAGPLAVVTASLADKTVRPLEAIALAVVMTALCIGLFSYLLRLPIPVMPTALPYPLNQLL